MNLLLKSVNFLCNFNRFVNFCMNFMANVKAPSLAEGVGGGYFALAKSIKFKQNSKKIAEFYPKIHAFKQSCEF